MIGQPSSSRVLLPVIAGRRGCALRSLYALRDDVADNEAVLAAAETILRRYRPTRTGSRTWSPASTTPARRPLARLAHRPVEPLVRGRAQRPRIDRLGPARPGLPHRGPGSCCCAGTAPWRWPSSASWPGGPGSSGSSPTRPALSGAGISRRSQQGAAPPATSIQTPSPRPTQPVGQRTPRSRSSTSCCWTGGPKTCGANTWPPPRPPMVRALREVRPQPRPAWKDGLLAMLDAMPPAAAAGTTVVVADSSERTRPARGGAGGPAASRYPGVRADLRRSGNHGTTGTGGAIFDLLQPFQRALLVTGQCPRTPGPGWRGTGTSATA